MENDKYGIELTADTHYFKDAMKELGQYIKAFGRGMKESFVEQTKNIAENFKNGFKNIKDVEDVTEDTTDEFEEMTDTAEKTSSTLSGLFDKSISKIKRFTYYLLGARSVFSLFMRYRSIYYQYNEEMQYQSELSQNAIALSLAPAFEYLGNIITYASIGLAKFIELLTGVNVLSKVTTKGIRDYNKSLKETQTLVSGIDEITNLTNPQTLGLADQYKALDDFQKKIAEVEKFFAENKWITDLANGLKTLWSFITEKIIPVLGKFFDAIGGVEGALIMLGGLGVMSAFSKLIGVVGKGLSAGTGLLGIASLLTFIAGTYVINLVIKSSDENEEDNKKRQKIAKEEAKNYYDVIKIIKKATNESKNLNKNSQEYNKNLNSIKTGWTIINSAIQKGDEELLNNLDDAEELAKTLDNMTNSNYFTKSLDISKAIGLDQANEMSKSLTQRLAGIFTGADRVNANRRKDMLEEFNEYEEKINNLGTKVDGLQSKFNKLVNKAYKMQLSIEIISSVGKASSQGAQALSDAVLKAIRGYASGLDYVPYDNYPALLHKGEAVVPAKYNPSIHSEGNDYTNSLLETLILKVDDLASRPNVFEIDGRQFATATYNLYDNERKKQGYIEGVVR